jgi:hypothetical protein
MPDKSESTRIFYNLSEHGRSSLLPVSTGYCPAAGQWSMAAAKPDFALRISW